MKVKVLEFYGDWCTPCKLMKTYLETLESEFPQVEFQYIDVGADENKPTLKQYTVMSVPTLIILQNDNIYGRISKVVNQDELKALIKGAL